MKKLKVFLLLVLAVLVTVTKQNVQANDPPLASNYLQSGEYDVVDSTYMASSYYVGSQHSFSVYLHQISSSSLEITICQNLNWNYDLGGFKYGFNGEMIYQDYYPGGTLVPDTNNCHTINRPITTDIIDNNGYITLELYGFLYVGNSNVANETLWDISTTTPHNTITIQYVDDVFYTQQQEKWDEGYQQAIDEYTALGSIKVDSDGDGYDDNDYLDMYNDIYNSAYQKGVEDTNATAGNYNALIELPGGIIGTILSFFLFIATEFGIFGVTLLSFLLIIFMVSAVLFVMKVVF